jgi:hypothetical protein
LVRADLHFCGYNLRKHIKLLHSRRLHRKCPEALDMCACVCMCVYMCMCVCCRYREG